MRANFLVPFAFMNGIQPFPRRVFQAAKERIPGIREAWGIDALLRPLGHITVADIRTPMQIRAVKKRQLRGASGLTPIRVRDIMTG
jgi:hypothetical protein